MHLYFGGLLRRGIGIGIGISIGIGLGGRLGLLGLLRDSHGDGRVCHEV